MEPHQHKTVVPWQLQPQAGIALSVVTHTQAIGFSEVGQFNRLITMQVRGLLIRPGGVPDREVKVFGYPGAAIDKVVIDRANQPGTRRVAFMTDAQTGNP
jgi:hypothetical protein